LMQVNPNLPAAKGTGAVNSNHSFLVIGSTAFLVPFFFPNFLFLP